MSILKMKDISKSFKDGDSSITVIDSIDFTLDRGKLVGVIGPSGSGKSTFLSIAGGLLKSDTGEIQIEDNEISSYSQSELTDLRKDSIGFIFQGSKLISYLNVVDQLKTIQKISGINDTDYIDYLIDKMGISHRRKAYPEELSGGEKQRVAIARAFVSKPALILADEPTANLDEARGYQVVEMIRKEIEGSNKSGVIVTHDNRLLDLMDEVYQLDNGKLVKQ